MRRVALELVDSHWTAVLYEDNSAVYFADGDTPLIAAVRLVEELYNAYEEARIESEGR